MDAYQPVSKLRLLFHRDMSVDSYCRIVVISCRPSQHADECTLSHTYSREQTQDVIESVNKQMREIKARGDRRQLIFAAEKSQNCR